MSVQILSPSPLELKLAAKFWANTAHTHITDRWQKVTNKYLLAPTSDPLELFDLDLERLFDLDLDLDLQKNMLNWVELFVSQA